MFLHKLCYEIESWEKLNDFPDKVKKHFSEDILNSLKDEIIIVTIKDNEVLKECPYCNSPATTREGGKRKIYDYNKYTEKVKIITYKSKYHRCLSTECGRSFSKEIPDLHGSRTPEFDDFIALRLLSDKDDIYSISNIGLPYGLKKDVISEIIHEYVMNLNLYHFPPLSCDILYLCPFNYQKKQRYFLAGINENNESTLLAFFGHEDADSELIQYIAFHKEYIKAKNTSLILTDFNLKLIRMLKKELENIPISIIYSQLKVRIDAYKKDYADGTYEDICAALKKLLNILAYKLSAKDKNFANKQGTCEEQLKKWWNDVCLIENTAVRKHLEPLYDALMECRKECLSSYFYQDIDMSPIMDEIKRYNRKKMAFDVMVARLMYYDKHDYILPNNDTCGFFDDKNNVLYRPAIPVEPKNQYYLEYMTDEANDFITDFVRIDSLKKMETK